MHPLIKQARYEDRVFLTELESKELLKQAGIKAIDGRLAKSKSEAITISEQLGFPVVMKIASPDIVHKSESGGIRSGLQTQEQVEETYEEIIAAARHMYPGANIHGVSVQKTVDPGIEVIIGMHKDTQFGPVLVFGLGGVLTEIIEDTSLRITPITRKDAREMIEEIKGYKLLKGYRGQAPVKISALEDILLAVSDFVENNPEIKEMDLNPVIASGNGAIAVDARVVLEEL